MKIPAVLIQWQTSSDLHLPSLGDSIRLRIRIFVRRGEATHHD